MLQRNLIAALTIALLAACAAPPQPSPQDLVDTSLRGVGIFAEITGFGSNPGGLKGYAYVPDNMPPNAPMVLALHACSQNATTYQNAGWNAVADRLKFYVLYPEQQSRNNGLSCFNWAGEFGDPTNLTRGEGENQSTIQMIEKMKADHSIDASKIYIMGHSGGAAQTALMIATWPEVFAGAGMIAGVPYNCTTTFTQVNTCLSPGINRTPIEWGDRARAGNPNYMGPRPRVQIWHGTSDTTVTPTNMRELMEQWTNTAGIDQTDDATDMVDGATRRRYNDAGGVTRVETIEIPNMSHGTPVDPQAGCGTAAAFFLDANICAVERMAEFFGLTGVGPLPDTTAPTVSFTAPRPNAMVSGVVAVQLTAMDNVAVTSVAISVNGTVRQTLSNAPYSWSWSTAGLANGTYTLHAVASDAAMNRGTVEVTVTLTGGTVDTQNPTVDLTSPASAATVSGTVQLRASALDDFTVAKVEFLVDNNKVGESTMSPYSYSWDSTSVAPGSHRLSARAIDGAGNTQLDDDTTVTVERLVITEGFVETFSGANRSPDRPGWALGDWRSDAADHTGMASSGSIQAAVTADSNSVEASATVPVRIGTTDTELALWRRMALRPASAAASAAFRVTVTSAGSDTVVLETTASASAVTEGDWTEVKADLAAFAGRDVTLQFEISASDASGPLTDARAWIDDIRMRSPTGNPMPTDTTPPTARFTSPVADTTVRGLITVKVEASDNTAVTVVFLFLGGDQIGSDYRAPYEFLWDTAVFSEGAQTLTARAFDAAGNLVNTDLALTVARGEEPGPEPDVTTVPAGRKYWGCNTTSAPGDAGLSLLLLLGVAALVRRRA